MALIIASNFLQDGRPFLLRAIKADNLSPLPFQAQFKWAHDLYLQLLKLMSFHLNNCKKGEQIIFKGATWRACMTIPFPTLG